MPSPLVSVIMSAYNAEKYISEAIESVLHQTYTHFQFLITDDCSQDSTPNIISKYASIDPRIIFIQKEVNRGVKGYIDNLNNMIRLAEGKYIAKFDADDIWVLNKLEIQFNYLENHPETFLLSSNAYTIDEEENVTGKLSLPHDPKVIRQYILRDNPFSHPSIMFRNENVFYRNKMLYVEDYDLYLRLFSSNKLMEQMDTPLLKYRVLESSISRKEANFIHYLFKRKAQEFYYQRIIYNTDNYDTFKTDNFLQLLNLNYISEKRDLFLAIKSTFVLKDYSSFNILIKKYYKQKSTYYKTLPYVVISLLGKKGFYFMYNIMSKIN